VRSFRSDVRTAVVVKGFTSAFTLTVVVVLMPDTVLTLTAGFDFRFKELDRFMDSSVNFMSQFLIVSLSGHSSGNMVVSTDHSPNVLRFRELSSKLGSLVNSILVGYCFSHDFSKLMLVVFVNLSIFMVLFVFFYGMNITLDLGMVLLFSFDDMNVVVNLLLVSLLGLLLLSVSRALFLCDLVD